MTEEAFTLRQAAERLGVHYMTAYRYVRLGLLPAYKEGGSWRIRSEDLDSFQAEARGTAIRGEAPWSERLESRMIAGDLTGAWGVIEAALAAGTEPAEVYTELLSPALESIGERWRTGALGVDDEHVASSVAARLVGRLSPRFVRRGRPRATVVTAMPEGERHVLAVAMLADVLRGYGFEVVDLGSDTPTESLLAAMSKLDRVDAVCLSVSYDDAMRALRRTIAALREHYPDMPLMLGGRAVSEPGLAERLGADGWAADPVSAATALIALLGQD